MKIFPSVIRDDVNYGDMSFIEVDCMVIAFGSWLSDVFLAMPGAKLLDLEEAPDFLTHFYMSFEFSFKNHFFYVIKQEHARPIAELLSRRSGSAVTYNTQARVLGRWVDGKQVGESRLLSSFYDNIPPEEDAMHLF